ncbi:hypothetical protein ACQCSJ_26330, partial [Ralstonia pseudosolanacearum]
MTLSSFRFAAAMAFAAASAAGTAFAQSDPGNIEMTAPLNGWRNSAGGNSRYTQDVHYPAVSVATPQGQGAASMIAGRIRSTPKAAAAYRALGIGEACGTKLYSLSGDVLR